MRPGAQRVRFTNAPHNLGGGWCHPAVPLRGEKNGKIIKKGLVLPPTGAGLTLGDAPAQPWNLLTQGALLFSALTPTATRAAQPRRHRRNSEGSVNPIGDPRPRI